MNIQPINYLPGPVSAVFIRKQFLPVKTAPLSADTVEISFTGTEESKVNTRKLQKPTDLEKGLHITGIHCPSCGKKMIAQDDFEEFISKFKFINYGRKYIRKLDKYREYIPAKYEPIIADGQSILKEKDMPLPEFYKNIKAKAFKDRLVTIRECIAQIKEILKDNPDQETITIYMNILDNPRMSYEGYKEVIDNMSEKLALDYNIDRKIKDDTFGKVKAASRYCELFEEIEKENAPISKLDTSIARNLFSKSISNITRVQDYPEHLDDPHNTCLECSNCMEKRQENVFWKKHPDYETLNHATRVYLGDIARLIGQNKIDANYNYLDSFIFVTRLLTRGRVNISQNELDHLSSLINCTRRQDEIFMPIEQTEISIPCAECGSTMLPHDKHIEIKKELRACSKPVEYAQVMEKYIKYIGEYAKPLAEIFMDIIDNNPEITEEEFIPIFQEEVRWYVEDRLQDAMATYQKRILGYKDQEDIDAADKIFYRTSEYIKDGKYADYAIAKMIVECVGNTSDTNLRAAYDLASDIRRALFIGSMSKINEEDAQSGDKDSIYTIMYKIFTADIATGDHLIARARGGDDSTDNIIGLCKACNRIKSRSSASTWYFNNPTVDRNLSRQLKIIDGMAKSKRISGYDNWAHNIAEVMYEATHGVFDVRELYPLIEETKEDDNE